MIRTFTDKVLKHFWAHERAKGIDPKSRERLKRILSALDAAATPQDLDVPGYAFHALKGDRKGQYAVEVRANFRLVFEWENGDAVRVRLEDYHGD